MGGVEIPNKPNKKEVDLAFEQLVEKATQGDADALCRLCEKISKGVIFQVTHILGGQANAEDVSQEVLIRVCENIEKLRSPKAFKVWLSRIIINEKNRYLAKNMKRAEVLNIEDYIESAVEDNENFLPQQCVENTEMRGAVMAIIEGLPKRQKEAVILHYYEGLSVGDIAETLEIKSQSVSKHLALAREKLRQELSEWSPMDKDVGVAGLLSAGPVVVGVLQGEEVVLFSHLRLQEVAASLSGYPLVEMLVTVTAPATASGTFAGVIAGICTVFCLRCPCRQRTRLNSDFSRLSR